MKMGNKNSGERKYVINENFFDRWSSQMAYILGFTCADGNVHERTLSWDLSDKYKSNYDLLRSFNASMKSNYPIIRRSGAFRLRVTNSRVLSHVMRLGIVPNKNKILEFPNVPKKYLRHFIRGFLDGDGWIVTRIRRNGGKEVCVGFSNGSFEFMKSLVSVFTNELGIVHSNLRKRSKLTKNGKEVVYYQLDYYSGNAMNILNYLYSNLNSFDLALRRKYKKVEEAGKFHDYNLKINNFGRSFVEIENRFGEGIIERFLNDGLIPREIAEKFGISLSTLYRIMDRRGIRKIAERGSDEWSQRIIKSKIIAI